jgi:hypothetical protein
LVEGGKKMKKLLLVGLLLVFLVGCGHMAKESEFYEHDAVYKNWDHLKFSMWGYKSPTAANAESSAQQGWWGVQIPYIPAQ